MIIQRLITNIRKITVINLLNRYMHRAKYNRPTGNNDECRKTK